MPVLADRLVNLWAQNKALPLEFCQSKSNPGHSKHSDVGVFDGIRRPNAF